jgi:uncharacterized membrane protein
MTTEWAGPAGLGKIAAGGRPPVGTMDAETVQFQATIVPHRSLSQAGLRLLLGAVVAGCVASSVAFAAIGAWPVGVFAGVELLLAGWLLHLHMRAARASEMLLLTASGLRLIRTSPAGRVERRELPADWLRVRLEERPGRVPALILAGGGVAEEVGRELGEVAKRSLAEALAEALHRRRHPVFDNPQLRDQARIG